MFVSHFGLTAVGARKEAGLLLQVNQKNSEDFYSNHGSFFESKHAKHLHLFVLDEDCRCKAAEWVQRNTVLMGKPNMTAAMLCSRVNSINMLSCHQVALGTLQIAVKWLNLHGFRLQSHKKKICIYLHEHDDVIKYCKLFLCTLESLEATHLPPPTYSDAWSYCLFSWQCLLG